MNETDLTHDIRLDAGRIGFVRLFRNQVGAFQNLNGQWVTFGLCEGSSDLIGWRSVLVTPAMVGRRLAVFVAIEVKKPGRETTKKERLIVQRRFINVLRSHGGLGGFARSVDEARKVLTDL